MRGADVTAAQYVEANRDLLRRRREVLQVFEQFDLVVTPPPPLPAPSFAELEAAPDQLRSKELCMRRNTRPFNAYSLPATPIPSCVSNTDLPEGHHHTAAPDAARAYPTLR